MREERRARDEKRAMKGGVPDEKRRDGTAHEAAFLMPVPMYMPVGFYGMPVGGGGGGCAATSGNMVDANSCPPGGEQMIAGSCAVGAGACGGGNVSLPGRGRAPFSALSARAGTDPLSPAANCNRLRRAALLAEGAPLVAVVEVAGWGAAVVSPDSKLRFCPEWR